MGGFRSVAYPLFGIFVMTLPVLLVGASALATLAIARSATRQRRAGFTCGLVGAGFILLDALLLKALPWQGLSYGPVLFSLVFLVCIRASMYVLWAGLQIRLVREKGKLPSFVPFLLANAFLTGLILYGFYFEPFNLKVTRVEVQAPAAKMRAPLRIVALSDLHVERITKRERRLVSLVQSLRPDVIVLTGDYLNLSFLQDARALQETRALFRQLSAPYGVYAVRGSVDGQHLSQALFSDMPISLLEDRVARIDIPGGKLAIIGVTDWDDARDGEMIARLSASIPADEYGLLLFHTPDQAFNAARDEIDLYLAGHTHGGQICLPFYGAIVTASVYGKRFEAGR
ncbi:MAG: hypothetical protein EHM21_18095, partial [Chloroflexi bacterium]